VDNALFLSLIMSNIIQVLEFYIGSIDLKANYKANYQIEVKNKNN